MFQLQPNSQIIPPNEMLNGSPIFIGGLMKSGTSLLRKLLSRHPHIFGGLETHWFLPEILDNWQDSSSTRQVWLKKFFDVSDEEYLQVKSASSSGIDFFNRFMWFCAGREGKKRWLEKTPDNISHLTLIWKYWPNAKVIHVVRDYRDVYASWKQNQKGSLKEYLEKVHAIMARLGDLAGKRTALYTEVHYETLVTSTSEVIKHTLDFVGEEWVEGLDQYEGDRSDYQKVLAVTGKESPTTVSLSKPIFTSSIGQWQSLLSSQEVFGIESELGRYMVTLGIKQ